LNEALAADPDTRIRPRLSRLQFGSHSNNWLRIMGPKDLTNKELLALEIVPLSLICWLILLRINHM
jgi:hypothetical protein